MLKHTVITMAVLWGAIAAFTPSRNMELLTEILDLDLDDKPISATLTHVDILRKGLVRSVTRYFAERQKRDAHPAKQAVNIEKSDEVYNKKLAELYKDYMGVEDYESIKKCGLRFEGVLKELNDAVAFVDFDKALKDLPSAHFDANSFNESNRHVQKLIHGLYTDILVRGNMASGRQKLGSLLHTVHDFYSHSNWIEMGNSERINQLLGTDEFDSSNTTRIVSDKEIACLSEKCVKKVLKCNHLKGLGGLVKYFGLNLPMSCPIVYFKCANNVVVDKLTSGYFTGQRLEDGEEVLKPSNGSKCSHGGPFDLSSLRPAEGGINKDTGYYFLSPRADLHLTAAELAVRHTEYLLNELRSKIGDHLFEEFLELFRTESPSITCFVKRIFSTS